MLVMTSVRDGLVLDDIRLVDGRLEYQMGVAREIVETPRRRHPDLTDERLYELAADWSNGYISISAEQGEPGAGG